MFDCYLFLVERREISSLDKGMVLTVLGKVGASISDFDELHERNISGASTLIFVWRILTPVPLSTTRGAEVSMLSGGCLK